MLTIVFRISLSEFREWMESVENTLQYYITIIVVQNAYLKSKYICGLQMYFQICYHK